MKKKPVSPKKSKTKIQIKKTAAQLKAAKSNKMALKSRLERAGVEIKRSPGLTSQNGRLGMRAGPRHVLGRHLNGGAAESNGAKVLMMRAVVVFKEGDKVVYPGHGVGEINSVVTKTIVGTEQKMFDITIMSSGMKVMVPVAQAEVVGLRKVADKKSIDRVYQILKNRNFKIDTQTWNRRFREYSQKIETGSVFEIAEVLRDLSVLSADKELSFGEKKMLDKAKNLLVSEISISRSRPHEKVMNELRDIFA